MAWRETIPESLTELSREGLIERVLKLEAQLAEAQAQIAELRRQLFGSKAEKLSPEQQAHLDELAHDLQQETQQPSPLSQEVLEEERRDQRRRRAERRAPAAGNRDGDAGAGCRRKALPPVRPPEAVHRRRSQ